MNFITIGKLNFGSFALALVIALLTAGAPARADGPCQGTFTYTNPGIAVYPRDLNLAIKSETPAQTCPGTNYVDTTTSSNHCFKPGYCHDWTGTFHRDIPAACHCGGGYIKTQFSDGAGGTMTINW